MPQGHVTGRRQIRTRADRQLLEAASKTCSKGSPENLDLCVEEVMATGDLDLAEMIVATIRAMHTSQCKYPNAFSIIHILTQQHHFWIGVLHSQLLRIGIVQRGFATCL